MIRGLKGGFPLNNLINHNPKSPHIDPPIIADQGTSQGLIKQGAGISPHINPRPPLNKTPTNPKVNNLNPGHLPFIEHILGLNIPMTDPLLCRYPSASITCPTTFLSSYIFKSQIPAASRFWFTAG